MGYRLDPTEQEWRTIDDVVMGGVSRSAIAVADGFITFSGVVSLENNGGFASVRSLPADHDLGEFDGLVLRLRGDGNRYALRLRTTDRFDGPSYQAMIEPDAGEWSELVVRFGEFEPVYRGRPVPGYQALDPSRVKTFGFLISGKQEGEFRLDIDWIRGWKASEDSPAKGESPADGRGRPHPPIQFKRRKSSAPSGPPGSRDTARSTSWCSAGCWTRTGNPPKR